MLNALVRYYDMLASQGDLQEECFSLVDVRWLICLNEDGTLADILEYTDNEITYDKKGKEKVRKVARKKIFPKRMEKTAIRSEFVEHRPDYIFGIDFNPKNKTGFVINKQKTERHDAFIKSNLEFTEGMENPLVRAYRAFIEKWKPEENLDNPILVKFGSNLSKSGYAFCLTGRPDELLNETPEILQKTREQYYTKSSDKETSICCITGEVGEIARTHDKIKNIRGGLATGNLFVCFHNPAEESYGKSQSYNSNISQNAMIKYTTALNRLLSDEKHKKYMEEMTLVYWAESQNDSLYSRFFAQSLDQKADKDEVDNMLGSAFTQFVQGRTISEILPELDENVTFYIMGMTPNSSRISLKLYCKNTFGNILKNAAQHQRDMAIGSGDRQISLNGILKELKSPKASKANVPSPLISDIFRAVLYGTNYPTQLLETVVMRVKTDSDDKKNEYIKLNPTRAGIIKACLNRKARLSGNKEEIKMALDKTNTSPAYLCGRLFAQLEKIQQAASNNSLNRTIKDSYFASACSTPALVFPRLIKLAQNHLKKLDDSNGRNYFMGEIINLLGNEFPKHLSLSQQGEFILGYYQEFYYKKEKTEE